MTTMIVTKAQRRKWIISIIKVSTKALKFANEWGALGEASDGRNDTKQEWKNNFE